MATKYYQANNCNRGFEGGVNFKPTRLFGGTWVGVFATEDEANQRVADSLAADPKTAVKEITEAEYNEELQRTGATGNYSPTLETFKTPEVKALPNPGDRLTAKAGVRVEEPIAEDMPTAAKPTAAPVEKVADVIKIETVETPKEAPKAKAPKVKAAE